MNTTKHYTISILLLLFIGVYSNTSAQMIIEGIGKNNYECYSKSLIATEDGGYALAGYAQNGLYTMNAIIVKLDSSGAIQWSKVLGNLNFDTEAHSIIQTQDGNYAVAGLSSEFGSGQADAYIFKLDSTGQFLWGKTMGGVGWDVAYSIIEASNGDLIATGAYDSDVYLFRISSLGALLWSQTYGGAGGEKGNCVINTNDNGFAITGTTNAFGPDVYILKTDSIGNLQWTRTVGGQYSDVGWDILQTPDGGYAVAANKGGYYHTNAYAIKLDSNGSIQWSKAIGSVWGETAYGIVLDDDGGFILAGSSTYWSNNNSSDLFIFKLDTSGTLLWDKEIGFDNPIEYGYALAKTSDGGYAIGGSTMGYPYGPGGWKFLFCKTNSTVNYCTASRDSIATATDFGSSNTYGSALGSFGTVDSGGNAVDFGALAYIGCYVPALGLTINKTDELCHGDCNGMITASAFGGDSTYTYSWNTFDSTATINGLCAGTYVVTLTDTSGDMLIDTILITEPPALSVNLSGTGDFGNCNGTATVTVSGGISPYSYQWDSNTNNQTTQTADSLCVGNYCVTITDNNGCTIDTCVDVTVGMNASYKEHLVSVYPNPVSNTFTVSLNAEDEWWFQLYDIESKLVIKNHTSRNSDMRIDVSQLQSGMYFYRIESIHGTLNGKLIIAR